MMIVSLYYYLCIILQAVQRYFSTSHGTTGVLKDSKGRFLIRSRFDSKKVRNLWTNSVARHVSSEGSIFVYNSARRPIKLRSDWE